MQMMRQLKEQFLLSKQRYFEKAIFGAYLISSNMRIVC